MLCCFIIKCIFLLGSFILEQCQTPAGQCKSKLLGIFFAIKIEFFMLWLHFYVTDGTTTIINRQCVLCCIGLLWNGAWIIDLDFPRFKLDTTECDPYFTGPWLHVSLTVMFLPPLWSDANLMAGPGMNFYNMMLANIRSKLVTIQWGWHCWWLNWISIHQQMPTLPITQALLSSDNKSSLN